MERVIVTVRVDGEVGADLELPANVAAAKLGQLVLRALRPQQDAPQGPITVEAWPPGRPLNDAETLADAGVWDGSFLWVRTGQAE